MKNITNITKLLLRQLVELVEFVCSFVYWIYLAIRREKTRRVIIYYHSIKKRDLGSFQKQMKYLANKCCVVKASQIKTAQANGKKIMVAITFDDGFISITKYALPILEKYGLEGALFVPTGCLGLHPHWSTDPLWYPDSDETIMSEKQIIELSTTHFEIFSHTVSHKPLTEFEDDRLITEMTESKHTLEKLTGKKVAAISYPIGVYNPRVCQAAEQAGYEFGFTTDPCMVDNSANNFQIGRFHVKPADNLLKFKLKVMGAYQVSMYLRTAKTSLKNCFSRTS